MGSEKLGMIGCTLVGLLSMMSCAEDRLSQYVAEFNAADVEHYTNAILVVSGLAGFTPKGNGTFTVRTTRVPKKCISM